LDVQLPGQASASEKFSWEAPGEKNNEMTVVATCSATMQPFGGTIIGDSRVTVTYKYELRPHVSVEFTYPVGQSPKVFTDGWALGAKATLLMPDGTRKDVSDSVVWSGDATFSPPRGGLTKPSFNRSSRFDDGPRQVTISVETEGVKASATQTFQTVNPRKGYARLNDKVFAPALADGSPAAPYAATGVITSGSSTVLIDGVPAARVGDIGNHCCTAGPNWFYISEGDPQVLIDGKPAARKQDATLHDCTNNTGKNGCSGAGKITEVASEALP
jgi:uncharacterized Zn-binding protein involved in type VI secretion